MYIKPILREARNVRSVDGRVLVSRIIYENEREYLL